LSEKILDINHRTDNGLKLDKKDISNIHHRFTELNNLLTDYDFNIIIDGGNVGFYNQTYNMEININFVRSIINQIILTTDKYILLIIHQRHQSRIKQLNINSRYLKIFLSPSNVDDDLFWLYSTLYSKAYILTNDQSRDNSCMIGYQNEIKQYLSYYQIKLESNFKQLPILNKYQLINNKIIITNNKIHIKLCTNKLICI
jgi:hypothetical protein